MKPTFEVQQILQQQLHELPSLIGNSWKRRTLYALAKCRTSAMGGHLDRCDNPKCNKLHLSYNSCRNRHCLPIAIGIKGTYSKSGCRKGKRIYSTPPIFIRCFPCPIPSMVWPWNSLDCYMRYCSKQLGKW